MDANHPRTNSNGRGTLVVIGGHEDRTGECTILRRIGELVDFGCILVATVASRTARESLWTEYQAAFTKLGFKSVLHLDVSRRADAADPAHVAMLERANAIFFTGGDQLRVTSEIGGTILNDAIVKFHDAGGVIAGTSAGASVICETMLVAGRSDETYRVGSSLRMAPGLGLLRSVIVDQHFAERGRIGRLLGAVAQNPRSLGIGIDENTAIVVENTGMTQVIGAGGVYVIDAQSVTASNISDSSQDSALSLFGTTLHLLSNGDSFDLDRRTPLGGTPED